jgi:sugar lactone lactonase YvrE
MHVEITKLLAYKVASLAVLIVLVFSTVQGADDGCEDSGEYSYICGPVSAEDLVLIPGTKWVVASGFGGNVSLYLVDSEQKTWSSFYPADEPRARQNMATYGACPGSPDPNSFVAHGLNIRPGADGHSTLYVVGHGEREAIEAFDVDARGDKPVLTWTGCVMTPDGMQANSVASLADGSLVATIPLHTGILINEAFSGRPTGAVYEWSPGDVGFAKIEGTDMPYGNGIEVSHDGQEFYVASSGLQKVLAFSNSNPARLLRSSKAFSFVPDNLHMGSDGNLLTAGLAIVDPACGDIPMSLEFDLGKFASCPRPFTVLAVDPQSMQDSILATSPAQEHFSNITMALEVGSELWIGTFAGDRIAYRILKQGGD